MGDYKKAEKRLLERAASNPGDAADLTAQAAKINAEALREEERLSGFRAELSALADTVAKLKDQDIDYEIRGSECTRAWCRRV